MDPARLVSRALDTGILSACAPRAVVAAGKAAWPMAAAVERRWPATPGVLAGVNARGMPAPGGFEIFEPGHPFPNAASAAAADAALRLAAGVRRNEGDACLLVLLSGGASAMLASPAAGVTLQDKIETSAALMRAGVAIDGLNTVRKHLSAVKGGRLAAAAGGHVVTLALSDVHGPIEDDPAVIGSGPTVGDPTTYADALRVIEASNAAVPAAVRAHLVRGASGELGETPKPGDHRLSRSRVHVIGNRRTALAAAAATARDRGYTAEIIEAATSGEARDAARRFAEEAHARIGSGGRPVCVVAAGETTVTVRGDGIGGRNQEFALAMVPLLPSFPGEAAAFGSAGTDGIDGPTDAAGACADSTTAARAAAAALDWRGALANNDAYRFFQPLGDLVRWGPTGTNVGDLHVLLVA